MAPLVGNSISPALPCMASSPVATDSLDIRAQWLLRPRAPHGEGKAGLVQQV